MAYAHKKQVLSELIRLEQQTQIDLFFTDECGFSLTPCIPYGWQPIGKQCSIQSAKGKVINLFGLLSLKGKLKTYSSPKSINSDFLIHCIDQFVLSMTRPTVLVLDNAPWHRSAKMRTKQRDWEHKDLYLFFLPKYSPQLNRIETLWRKMKYEWLRPEHYLSAHDLKQAVCNIIRKYDHDFSINFSMNL